MHFWKRISPNIRSTHFTFIQHLRGWVSSGSGYYHEVTCNLSFSCHVYISPFPSTHLALLFPPHLSFSSRILFLFWQANFLLRCTHGKEHFMQMKGEKERWIASSRWRNWWMKKEPRWEGCLQLEKICSPMWAITQLFFSWLFTLTSLHSGYVFRLLWSNPIQKNKRDWLTSRWHLWVTSQRVCVCVCAEVM